MFERDYLMRLLVEFAVGIRRAMEHAGTERATAESARMLDDAVGRAVDFDGDALLALSPNTVVNMMQVTGVDPRVTEYAARSVLLAARYYAEAGDEDTARLRRAQAHAIADAYGHVLPGNEDEAAMERFLEHEQGQASPAGV